MFDTNVPESELLGRILLGHLEDFSYQRDLFEKKEQDEAQENEREYRKFRKAHPDLWGDPPLNPEGKYEVAGDYYWQLACRELSGAEEVSCG